VVVHGRPDISPWIDMNDLRRRGAAIVWEGEATGPEIDQWRATFPGMELQPPLVLPRQTLFRVKPSRVFYAFLPPRP
jgi:hypothetical protein